MVISQSSYDRYNAALKDYEKIAGEGQKGWEAYREEAGKIRAMLAKATVAVEVSRLLGKQ